MVGSNKAFSFFEILLFAAAVCLLSAALVPAVLKVGEENRISAIEKRLNSIVDAARRYNADKGSGSVDYKTLVESKYIPTFEPVAGESYEGLTISSKGAAAVRTSKGRDVSVQY